MTRKDYVLIAAAMLKSKPRNYEETCCVTTWLCDCNALANALASDNVRFNRDRFLKACGAIKANDA